MNENNAGKVMQAVQTQAKQNKQKQKKELDVSCFFLYSLFAWAVHKDAVIMQREYKFKHAVWKQVF